MDPDERAWLAMASLAHELRTPLAAIFGASENLEDLLAEEPGLEVQASLRTLQAASKQACHLLEQMLEDAALAAGHLRLNPQPVAWGAMCEEVLAILAPRAQAGGQRLVLAGVEVAEGWADPLRLRQILLNLGENALKFSPPGGRVCLGVGHDEGGGSCAWWSDEGPGVPEAQAEAIFDRFQRGGASGQVRGVGLGLAIARRLAEGMGGALWLTNPGEPGACFRLRLPPRPTAA